MKKKGLGMPAALGIFMLAAVVISVSLVYAVFPMFGMSIGGGQGTVIISDEIVTSPGKCVGGETQSYDPNTNDLEATGTALTEATNMYSQLGVNAWTTFTAGTAITTLETAKDYEFVYGISSSNFVDNAYGPHIIVRDLPCRVDSMVGLYQDSSAAASTLTFYNADDNAAAQTGAADTVHTFFVKAKAGSNTVYGNPFIKDDPTMSDNGNHRKAYPNAICIQGNLTTTDITSESIAYLADGTDLNRIGAPSLLAAATGDIQWCFEAPVYFDKEIKVYFTYDTDASEAPADDATMTYYTGDYFVTTQGDLAWGIETDNAAAVGITTAETVAVDFT